MGLYENEREEWMLRRSFMMDRQKQVVNMLIAMSVFMLFSFLIIYIGFPIKGILEKYEQRLAAEVEGMRKIPSIQKEIDSFEKRLASLTSQSIDSRLQKIERAIKVGSIKTEEVATLQEISTELGILKSYMFQDPKDLVELKQLQKNYQELNANRDKYISKEDALREISFVQNLFYSSIGIFGLLLAVMGGSWWQSSRKLKKFDERLAESRKGNTEQGA